MKKIAIFATFFFLSAIVSAQTYFNVPAGYGTLDSAIAVHQGNVIYRLQAGAWYGLNGLIQNNGYPLTIVGTTPAPGQFPAEIQAATNPDGTVMSPMFSPAGDLTIRDVFIVNANTNNVVGGYLVDCSSATTPLTIRFDSVTVDPVATNRVFAFEKTPNPSLFLTNCLFLRWGNIDAAGTGWFYSLESSNPSNGVDTLYVENNTFLCNDNGFGVSSSYLLDHNHFVWVNHNTFIFGMNQFIRGFHMDDYYVTNNLFFDYSDLAYLYAWNLFYPDGTLYGGPESYQSLVEQDTASYDSTNGKLLSSRKLFVEYNSYHTDSTLTAYVTTWPLTHTVNNDGVTPIPPSYLHHLMYFADSAKYNREAAMCNDKAQFPYFYEGHYWDNSLAGAENHDTDPQWVDPRMYALQDSMNIWTLPANEINAWGFSNPAPLSQEPNWISYNLDSTYNLGSPEAWPRANCTYTNSWMQTASIEGLPLGDLNWYPQAKAIWEKNRASIMTHILNEDTTRMVLTSIKQVMSQTPAEFTLSQNYPNPFNPTTEIEYSVSRPGFATLKVYNVLGQEIATLFSGMLRSGNYVETFDGSKYASGVYFYTLHQGDNTITKKLLLLK